MVLRQRRVIESHGIQGASRKTLDQDVALLYQTLCNGRARGALYVQGEAFFPRVEVQERGALFHLRGIVHKRSDTARPVTCARRLDFDDLGTQTGKNLRAKGTGNILATIEHTHIA